MKYFSGITNLEELKKTYRRLAMENHPDRGGDTETMKAINAEYEEAFNRIKYSGQTEAAETASEFIAVIDALMKIKGITVELCGSWLWISGETKSAKDALKAAGCRWASKKKMWYWHPATDAPRHRRGNTSMTEIRSKYGSRVLTSHRNNCMATS